MSNRSNDVKDGRTDGQIDFKLSCFVLLKVSLIQWRYMTHHIVTLYLTRLNSLDIQYFSSTFNTNNTKKVAIKEFHDHKLKSFLYYVWFFPLYTIGLMRDNGMPRTWTSNDNDSGTYHHIYSCSCTDNSIVKHVALDPSALDLFEFYYIFIASMCRICSISKTHWHNDSASLNTGSILLLRAFQTLLAVIS